MKAYANDKSGDKDTSYKQMYSYDTGEMFEEKAPSQATKKSITETLKKTEQTQPSEKPSLMAILTATQKATDAVKAGIVKTAQNSR